MALFSVQNIKVGGMACCVPPTIDVNDENPLFQDEEGQKIIKSVGVRKKRIADDDCCSSDLCYQAAEKLILDMGINKEDIECLIFVTQSPDYRLPATSCLLQERLGLSKECHTIDISLGCSGWVYGLSMISALMSVSQMKYGLLLVGETTSKMHSREDRSAWPLFGDAGTATLLEYEEGCSELVFHTASDGSGANAIIMPDGGYRHPFSEESLKMTEDKDGNKRAAIHSKLDGMDVFSFAISKVPKSIKKVLEKKGLTTSDIDYVILHQANKLINDTIKKKLKLTDEQVPSSIEEYGNTSGATIVQNACARLSKELSTGHHSLIACGYGVGLSWATVYFEINDMYCSEIIDYKK